MKRDTRECWYAEDRRIAVTMADVTSAVATLARGHLSGPVATYYLAKASAACALLATETSEREESLILQMKCSGPLGGFNVECTAAGTLRGYTERKILDDFDGLGVPKDAQVLGDCRYQVTRSLPGRILSQGVADSLDSYLADSLQRQAVLVTAAAVSDEVEVAYACGIMVERLPDSPVTESEWGKIVQAARKVPLTIADRNLLGKLGLERAELKSSAPLAFACRCNAERAVAMLAALSPEERATLPETIDITCHMCGKTFTVRK